MNTGSASATPTLFVNGNLVNQNGAFTNSGSFLELKGNIANNPTTYNYISTGIERFSGSSNQTIYGTWNGTASNRNQFYNLKIYKTVISGENIILDNGVTGNTVNINATGTLNFEGTNGIIRTQSTSSTSPFTGNYANTLNILNTSTSAIINASTNPTNLTRYIEGKLQRQVNSGTYYFPVGVEKTGLDGMEAFSITINSLSASTGLLGYIQNVPAGRLSIANDLIANGGVLFYDIGSFSNPTQNNFSQCVGGPDGHDDVAVIDQAITHEWMVIPSAAPASVDYDISVSPGTVLENQITYSMMGSPCNGLYNKAQYLARDGRIGGNSAVGPTVNYWVPGVQGLYQRPTLKILDNQNGFSRFRLFGASDNNTSLPVELTKFYITPVNNEYFNLNWETASELNNAGFYIQRSTAGTPFENIGWVSGNGTTSSINKYSFTDRNVIPNTIYYYRLQQIDINQAFKYSNTLSGILNASNDFNVLNIVPNPTTINPQATVFIPENGKIQISIYDILGQNLNDNFISLSKGNNIVDIDMSDLATATYLVKFNYNNTTIIKKIIKN